MTCHQIRRLTGPERAARDERDADLYEAMRFIVEAEMQEAYESDFGPAYRAKFPFVLNGQDVHDTVLQRLYNN